MFFDQVKNLTPAPLRQCEFNFFFCRRRNNPFACFSYDASRDAPGGYIPDVFAPSDHKHCEGVGDVVGFD